MTGITLSVSYAKYGDSITVTAQSPNDADGDALNFYCATTSPASSTNADFCSSTGNTSPYSISCTGTNPFNDDASHTIYCVLYDGAAYSTEHSANFTSDNTAPSTTDDAPTGWQTTDVNIHLTCSDSGSGCSTTQYRIDGGSWLTYDTNILISADGNHQIDYNSTDNVGNVESTHTIWVAIDTVAPSTAHDAPTGWQADDVNTVSYTHLTLPTKA